MDPLAILADPTAKGAVIGALALVLFRAGWHKLSEPHAFLSVLAAYRIVPERLLDFAARAVPVAEIALGTGLLVSATRGPALAGVVALMLAYSGAIAANLLRGRRHIECGCGGSIQPLSWGLVARNGVLAAAAAAAGGGGVDRPLAWLDAVTLVIGALALYFAYLLADELLRLASRRTSPEQRGGERNARP
jgi:uncharacterized membrane protein